MALLPTKYSFLYTSKKKLSNHTSTKEVDAPIINESIITDDDRKRSFLKLAGIAGIGIVASQLLPKQAGAYVLGSTPTSNVVGVKNISNARVNPSTEDGNLLTVKTNTTAFITPGAGGYVRQDSTGTIAKESGGNLDAIKVNLDKLKFDAGNNLLTSSSGGGGGANATDIGVSVNDQSIWMLRKIITLLKPLGMTTGAQSNRLSIDVNAITTLPTLANVTTVGTVTNVNTMATLTNLSNIGNINAFSLMKDSARNAYANSMRSKISF